MRILILGGTGEASALVRALAGRAGFDLTLSLAGRTASPRRETVATRIGGFGGAEGLARYLSENRVDRLVDATHPFAARMSRNAAEAARAAAVPLLAIRRPAWLQQPGDRWTEVDSVADCVTALGESPRTVFLTIGRQEVAAFAAAPQHAYVVRTIEPVGGALPVPRLTELQARGPFDGAAEADYLREAGIEILVSKNAGGAATYGKIAAARALRIPVVMVRRPEKPDVPSVADADAAVLRLAGG
ncbi:cobalt-precorrin-6A reductase [Methylobacterium trifolii]|uniref:Precorrin-6A reductase n=1 Tax=Methylobacterium trifolii TaxID=1003092 RepID=A0ABQ4U4S7_9HYPH|nr:Precorrin-6A reductase [Methylobacterium trifolii]